MIFDFLFGSSKGPSNLEYDIINNDNTSGLFGKKKRKNKDNTSTSEDYCENCGELLEDCECEEKEQSRKDAGIIDYDEIDELEDMEENDFDDEDDFDW